ncbi:hypothetical protein NV379_11510 [Paenibacillus sp. N1-5-1-14]|uniref:hypothetical protein n=1 Tax=Paenibacillus radicibacter TaxID=2972488 RepID=UPI002158CDBE|nr:hypothetical protein [Paenibacillus radicibacter]MCR8643289.1 hypothetical protein [Paenibacillus radicibacter]
MPVNAGKLIKLVVIVIGVIALNIVVFSPGFLGLKIGGNALSSALAVSLLVGSLLGVIYGVYTILVKKPEKHPIKQMITPEDYEAALRPYKRVKVLEADMDLALQQMDRLQKKQETLSTVLSQRFDQGGLSYQKFASITQEVYKLFYLNIRSILNRLSVFDEAEFESLMRGKSSRLSAQVIQEKTKIYNDYLSFVKNSINTNEEILLKLDRLLLEISLLDSLELGDIEQMACMQEIDSLIKQTKYYKQ